MVRKAPSSLSGLVPAARSPIIHEFSHTVNRYFDGSEIVASITNQVSRFDWAELYADHLLEWDERLSVALAAAHFDSVVVFAGAERTRFRDDQNYPYVVEPYFKGWLPLTDHPGSVLKLTPGERPLLIDLREDDFWHEAPAEPGGFWVDHFEGRRDEGVRVPRGTGDSYRRTDRTHRQIPVGERYNASVSPGLLASLQDIV